MVTTPSLSLLLVCLFLVLFVYSTSVAYNFMTVCCQSYRVFFFRSLFFPFFIVCFEGGEGGGGRGFFVLCLFFWKFCCCAATGIIICHNHYNYRSYLFHVIVVVALALVSAVVSCNCHVFGFFFAPFLGSGGVGGWGGNCSHHH